MAWYWWARAVQDGTMGVEAPSTAAQQEVHGARQEGELDADAVDWELDADPVYQGPSIIII